jgi:hypothetical protein
VIAVIVMLVFMVAVSPYLSHATLRAVRARAAADQIGAPMNSNALMHALQIHRPRPGGGRLPS